MRVFVDTSVLLDLLAPAGFLASLAPE